VRGLLPPVVVFAHDVAVHARLRVVGEVRQPLGVVECVRADTHEDAEEDRQAQPEERDASGPLHAMLPTARPGKSVAAFPGPRWTAYQTFTYAIRFPPLPEPPARQPALAPVCSKRVRSGRSASLRIAAQSASERHASLSPAR